MGQLVQVSQQAGEIQRIFEANHTRMLRMAPRTTADPNRLLSIAFSAIAYNSDLVTCTPQSLFGGVMEALKLGLTIGGPMQEAWLIPFTNRGQREATLIIGYQGYRNIIDRARSTLDLHPRAVYANDDFDFEYGTNPRVHHKPYWMVSRDEPGPLIAVYAVARLRGGGLQLEVMPKAEVDAHRARSRAKESGPWVTDFDAMALKTVLRKISKYLPKSNELLARALQLDEQADLGQPQTFDVSTLVLDPVAPAAKQIGGTAVDKLKDSLKQTPPPATEAAAEPAVAAMPQMSPATAPPPMSPAAHALFDEPFDVAEENRIDLESAKDEPPTHRSRR